MNNHYAWNWLRNPQGKARIWAGHLDMLENRAGTTVAWGFGPDFA